MGTIEQPVVGPQDGHSNGKALVALALGLFAMANVIVFAAIFIIDAEALDRIGAWWMLLPFFGLVAGFAATLIGSISWINVRQGTTDQRLLEAKLGTVLGGIAAALVVIGIAVLLVMLIVLAAGFASEGGID